MERAVVKYCEIKILQAVLQVVKAALTNRRPYRIWLLQA